MTLTAFDDVVDGARKVDLTDAPGDAIATSTCQADVAVEPGDSYQCTYTRTHTEPGTARDLALVVAVDNEGSQAEGSAAASVTVTARTRILGDTQTPSSLSSTGASIAAILLLATALTALGGGLILAKRRGPRRSG